MLVEVWADVVCPWCHIGRARLAAALAGFPHSDAVEVVHRSFELDPTPREATYGPTAERLAAKYGTTADEARGMVERVAAVAAADGLVAGLPEAHQGNTRDAHRLLHLAAERGRGQELLATLYTAQHADNVSVFEAGSLADLAASVGLDREEALAVLAGDAYDDEVRADEDEARALGITGVPFFVLDRRYAVSGAQPVEVLRAALEQAWAEHEPAAATAG